MEGKIRGLDLERELTCSICTEVLYAPRTLLDCLHTFCGSCLKEWFAWQLSSWRSTSSTILPDSTPYTCPSCRAPVRDTKHNSSVTTLLEMFLAANPGKCRSPEELVELQKYYSVGDHVLPKETERKRKTLRERQIEEADRRMVDEVRQLSLREVGMQAPQTRRDHERYQNQRLPETTSRRNQDDPGSRERNSERHSRHSSSHSNTTSHQSRRSNEERSYRHEDSNHTNNNQHNNQLRSSLLSPSDVDSKKIEEEILRQIREEGLLDGIDLENIDVRQEDLISERIAEAFRRRQNERARKEPTTSHLTASSRDRNISLPESPDKSGHDQFQSATKTQHNRPKTSNNTNVGSHARHSRPPPSMSVAQAAHLEVHSSDEYGQKYCHAGRSNKKNGELSPTSMRPSRPITKSAYDLRARSNISLSQDPWPATSKSSQSSIDLTTPGHTSFAATDLRPRPMRRRCNSGSQSTDALQRDGFSNCKEQRCQEPPISGSLPPSKSSVNGTSEEMNLVPAPLSLRKILPDNLNTQSYVQSRPSSSSSSTSRNRSPLFKEPLINCARCSKPRIEYEWHYNCGICLGGYYNVCLSCYRLGHGCLYWLGVGSAAWKRWKYLQQSGDARIEKPHIMTPCRYLPPKLSTSGIADTRSTLTTEDPKSRLQSGTFCTSCFAWTNDCYWRCYTCNDGDWGFCNSCVNQGQCCTHPIVPMSYEPRSRQRLSTNNNQKPPSALILSGPGVTDLGPFKPLSFSTKCDICRYPIQPSQTRYHCFSCSSTFSDSTPGDYDICTNCYPKLIWTRRISIENGPSGWRRCLQGHRMVVVGFEDKFGGQARTLVEDMVGGRCLRQKSYNSIELKDQELQLWSWGDGVHVSGDDAHKKITTTDVSKTPPASVLAQAQDISFPPNGGTGMRVVAKWGWYPVKGVDDELLFPRGAEIRECKDVNGDWFYGSYMGRQGLFPSNYVRVIDGTS
ncbi:unnamed protein product [Blumeria hordei]|uniref:RING-type domain-containing protein n=1 Tax=Blumeria hordei TaxID=2867405 RepID=A0A383UJI2_BLUHO|nr:unnamed protein product [Blumeria hordei]